MLHSIYRAHSPILSQVCSALDLITRYCRLHLFACSRLYCLLNTPGPKSWQEAGARSLLQNLRNIGIYISRLIWLKFTLGNRDYKRLNMLIRRGAAIDESGWNRQKLIYLVSEVVWRVFERQDSTSTNTRESPKPQAEFKPVICFRV